VQSLSELESDQWKSEIDHVRMSTFLEGGCYVSHMSENVPVISGTLSQRNMIGAATGAQAISLRILEFTKGLSPGIRTDADTVLYRLESSEKNNDKTCTAFIDGRRFELPTQTGLYVRPGQTLAVLNEIDEPVVFVGSQCPESVESSLVPAITEPQIESATTDIEPLIRLQDRAAIPTADRWYRVLVDDELGSTQVTQFVGSIPPGRAPDHFHNYEEVLFILRGEGRMWGGNTNTPIGPGHCIYLPKGQVHCVENTGSGELRLLGVFYPAGSPAVRYES
jgi:mannose-6-phosphate isomerase-like protein (cupin superfamily)